MAIPAGARLGGFEVLGPLGAGGMGEVYRARDTRLGREVALKVLPESLASDRERLARFEQEARAASALNHPNIVTIHEIGREGEVTFVAMELVDGKTLRELSVSGPMPVKKVLNVAAQVSEGLAKAHGAGIVHRDLKPENVMVSRDGFVKILDFGLAKLIETDSGEVSAMPTVAQPETRPGTVMGTVGYMSPEQASGEPLDYRSDQFSLGSVVYEMLTGKKPFQRRTAAETMSAIIREEPEPASRLRPDLPLPVRWVLDRCMAKDRDERYASTRDLARDLAGLRDHLSEATSGGETLLASPARRRLRPTWIAAALVLAAGTGLAGWLAAKHFSPKTAAPTFKRLSFLSGSIGNARFAPDGQTIVYGHGSTVGESRLFLTRLGSSESKPFEFPGDILSISRSGDLAIWQRSRGRITTGLLAVVPMTGGAPRPLVEDVMWASADWDPNGRDLAVVHKGGRLEFPIGNVLVPQGALGARFSPDGREIAFWKEGEGTASLDVVDRLGKEVRALSSGWNPVAGGVPCWTADGREIWFTASKPGELESLWAVRRSGQLRQLVRVPGALELYDVSRDGRVLIGHHTLTRVLRGQAAGQSSEIELAWLDSSYPADLSTDGTTMLITEDGEGAGSGGPAIYIRTTDGAPAARIAEGEAVALSPDKQWVLAKRKEGGRRQFVMVPTGAGQSRPLVFEGLDVGMGAFTPDGKEIVFEAVSGGKTRIYAAAIAGGKARAIGRDGLGFLPLTSPLSPDGRRAVAVAAGKLVVFPLDGSGSPRELPGLSPPLSRAIQWSEDSRSLYVYELGSRPLQVDLYDVETGRRRPWKQIPIDKALARVQLRVTPDGKTYVYGAFSAFSGLYLVEGLR